MSDDSTGAIPGWYGKLPSLGDFVSRRLPPEFIRTWDAWLQEMLHATRRSLGEEWLDCYLTTPIWRFVLVPGLVGSSGWSGILMPSVDRVGRHFPLTVALALRSYAAAAHAVFDGSSWFAAMEEAALAALDMTRGPDDLDRALVDRALPAVLPVNLDGAVGIVRRLPTMEAFTPLAKAEALNAWSVHEGWKGLWWTRGRVDAHPLMLVCAGLPTAEEFGWLLQARGFSEPSSGVPPRHATA